MGNMLSKIIQNEKHRNIIIQNSTKTQILFPDIHNQGKKPTVISQPNYRLPSTYALRTSKQINKNILPANSVIQYIPTQSIYNAPNSFNNKWPQTCIGLVFCEHHQNNNIYYVYGTGILIHNKVVLTNANNVYCRRLHKEYINIKFISGVIGNKCSGIYDVMRVHYPKEYTKLQGYEQFDFAVLQLYDDLTDICGYVGWKTNYKRYGNEIITYGYMGDDKEGYFNLRQQKKYGKLLQHYGEGCSGSFGLMKEQNYYYLVGLYMTQIGSYKLLSKEMRDMINEWTTLTKLKIITYIKNDLNESCEEIVKLTTKDLRQLVLYGNDIDSKELKILSQANWTYLKLIILQDSKIDTQGCKYLSQNNWKHLTYINLQDNNIDAQGCKYLSQSDWKHLAHINLNQNMIDAQGCKYLSHANWLHLNEIQLELNNINNIRDIMVLKDLCPIIKI